MCTYLAKRGSTYYFRRVIPVELRPAMGGRSEFMISLRTKDRETAKRAIPLHADETSRLLDEAAGKTLVSASETPAESVSEPEPTQTPAEAEQAQFEALEASEKKERWDARAAERMELRRKLATFRSVDLPIELQAARDLVRERDEAIARVESQLAERERERLSGALPPAIRTTTEGAVLPLLETYDAYAKEAGIKAATRTEWRAIIERLVAFLGHNDAARITADDLYRWKEELLAETTRQGKKRDPRTVRGKHLGAIRATLGWAVEKRKLRTNVASDVSMRVPRKAKLRDRDFTAGEAKAILKATLAAPTGRLQPGTIRARRWIPWLCAYTGARVNEISQLRGQDVRQIDGIWTIRITPEAGTVKANEARIVPLHPHIIEQGFLPVVEAHGDGPLFFDPSRQRVPGDGNRHFKKVGERLAQWVRGDVGITDPNLQPNHGWRHTFKTRASSAEIPERVADAIQGHAPATVSRAYGSVPLKTMADAMERMPRFEI
jgi:integrase